MSSGGGNLKILLQLKPCDTGPSQSCGGYTESVLKSLHLVGVSTETIGDPTDLDFQ